MVGVVMVVTSSALAMGGLALRVADEFARDSDGYLMSSIVGVRSPGHAVLTEDVVIDNESILVDLPERLVGRVKVAATGHSSDLFVGIANSDDVQKYLAGVATSTLLEPEADGDPTYDFDAGGSPATTPGDQDFWLVSAQGSDRQMISFIPERGDWTIVVMNADGSSPVAADVAVGATLPLLDDLAYGLLTGGLVLLVGGAVVLWASLRRRTT
jgi:hypothetical protein